MPKCARLFCFPRLRSDSGRASFTLIELLIVIAIVAILAVAVVLVLNPAELLKESRDAIRLSDMDTLNHGILFYEEDVGGSLGTASTTYISVPDPAATSTAGDECQGLGLPTSTAFSWHCAASSTYQDVNGTGWIPIDFTKISFKQPFGALPKDPTNTTSSGLYYTYTPGGSYELTALMESTKYQVKAATDGGTDPAQYEVGSDLSLAGYAHGLVGYWTFDEGSGTSVYDSSGNGNTGTMYSNYSPQTTADLHVSSGCIEGSCASFDGARDIVLFSSNEARVDGALTVAGWVKKSIGDTGNGAVIARYEGNGGAGDYFLDFANSATCIRFAFDSSWGSQSCGYPDDGRWHFVASTFDGSTISRYVDGSLLGTEAYDRSGADGTGGTLGFGNVSGCWSCYSSLNGYLDDIRIYNRALSAAEISAIYNAEE